MAQLTFTNFKQSIYDYDDNNAFSMTQTEILTEQLYYYPNGRRSLVFSHDERKGPDKKDVYEFKFALKRPMDVAANTSRKTLFISRASQMDRDLAKQVFRYFCDDIVLDYHLPTAESLELMLKERKQTLLDVLRTADSDIVDIQMRGDNIVTYHRNNPDIAFDYRHVQQRGTCPDYLHLSQQAVAKLDYRWFVTFDNYLRKKKNK